MILFPEDRAKPKEQAINVTLEDDKVKTLLVRKNQAVSKGETSLMRDNWDKIPERLSNAEERKILELIIDEGGTISQSQLVDRSGHSKSKVRLLPNRLEARKISERRRRGTSNVTVLE